MAQRRKVAKKRAPAARKGAAAKKRAPRRAHRLARDVKPLEADLQLELDPQHSPDFRGEVSHRLRLARRRRSIELHCADLRVSGARVETGAGGKALRARTELHEERQTIELHFDELLPAGEVMLQLAFRGRLRSDLRGLYAARSGQRRYALTHLEATDARRVFPCFDEPALKARFAISVTTGSGNTVISNAPAAREEQLPGGRKRVHFERTPLLSTYLLALAVGEFEASPAAHCGATEIRIWHVPGKGALTAFGLSVARETLQRLERYFDLPYPYAKLDLVAAPDFEAGAMENAGAVFFRELLLLLNPDEATLEEKKRIAEVICHELAHMWFGDLVTMAWWDDLWLNEAFATWMAYRVVDDWKPEWHMWNDFQRYKSQAYALDALRQTHPVYTTVRSPEEAAENFDAITYEKGASVVRMLEGYLGADVFRDGVRRYIRRHREGNAVADDLWRALSEASGQAVAPVAHAWIAQPGFPLLRLSRKNGALRYRQERFFADQKAARRAKPVRWPIPWVGRTGGAGGAGGAAPRQQRALLEKRSGEIKLRGAGRFFYGNAEESGFFHPLHDADALRGLVEGLAELEAVERLGLLGHQWAIVRSGRAEAGGFLNLALALAGERDPDVLGALRGPLESCARAAGRVLGPKAETALRGRVGAAFAPAFEALGWQPRPGEPERERMRRASLLALTGEVARRGEVLESARQRCLDYLAERSRLEPNLINTVLALAAWGGDEALWEQFLAAKSGAETPQEERHFLFALGAFRNAKLVRRTLALCLGEEVGTQDVALLLGHMLGNPAAAGLAWAFMQRRWPRLRRRLPPGLVTRPIEALPALATRAARREVAAFFRANPVPTGQRSIRQALERFDIGLAFDARVGPALRRWLSD
ncbi:MAG: M1 family metallopeptidase [Deltaproteobacteria bacterium]|nr:M1 family metallopeptidase [Deltaproteobacteria bacterium]